LHAASCHNLKSVGRPSSRIEYDIIGGGKYLKRSSDVQQLYEGKSEQLDYTNGMWREPRVYWHCRQSLPG
jgi:hypothetical protein